MNAASVLKTALRGEYCKRGQRECELDVRAAREDVKGQGAGYSPSFAGEGATHDPSRRRPSRLRDRSTRSPESRNWSPCRMGGMEDAMKAAIVVAIAAVGLVPFRLPPTQPCSAPRSPARSSCAVATHATARRRG